MAKKNELVRVNKEINLNKVDIEEGFQNFYVNILQAVNQMEKYEPINLTTKDLSKFLGANSKNSEYLHNIFIRLTSSNSIEIGDKKFYGSVFSVRKEKDNYKIYVNEPFRDLLFTKSDLNLMAKVKKYKHLPLSTEEQEYWDKTLKEKKQFLMILNNASIRKLKRKNNKIIYSMLKEFSGSRVKDGEFKGQSYRKISYSDFKKALGVSETYRNNNIEGILERAKVTITKETEVTITEIKKFPEGRGAKKQYMIFYFYDKGKYNEDENIIDVLSDETAEQEEKEIVEDERVIKLKELVRKQIKASPKYFELWGKIICINDYDKLMKFIAEENLLINYELLTVEN